MFILRQFDGEDLEFNLSLGDHYHITYKEKNKDKFDVFALGIDGKGQFHEYDKCYAFVTHVNSGKQESWPLYKGHRYYIMTGGGETFDNLTLRE